MNEYFTNLYLGALMLIEKVRDFITDNTYEAYRAFFVGALASFVLVTLFGAFFGVLAVLTLIGGWALNLKRTGLEPFILSDCFYSLLGVLVIVL